MSAAEQIIVEVAQRHGISVDLMAAERRDKATVEARHEAMREIHNRLGWSYARIGRIFNRDHSTVRYACTKDAVA